MTDHDPTTAASTTSDFMASDAIASDLVPTIDLSQAPEVVGQQFDAAYRDVGFCQIVNHGLDQAVEQAAWDTAIDFFALGETEKLETRVRDGEAYGYIPFGAEALAASLGEETPPDLKETFGVGPFTRPAGLEGDSTAEFVFSPNRWTPQVPEMEHSLKLHYEQLAKLVEKIMGCMAIGLGLDANFFHASIDSHASALRLLHYPHLDTEAAPGQLRAGSHADYGTLTLLRQDNAPGGLEVKGNDGDWHAVASVEGAYVLNVGDALARWTNDRWCSTLHRVAVPPVDSSESNERYSMAFFHNANWDAKIECIPTCLQAGDSPRYAPTTAGQHLMDKFLSTQ